MKHTIPYSSVFLSVEDFVQIDFYGTQFYGFVIVATLDFILVWVGRDSRKSTTDNTLIVEVNDPFPTITKFYIQDGSRWSDDIVGSVHVPSSEGLLSEFTLKVGRYGDSIWELLRRNQLSKPFIERFFKATSQVLSALKSDGHLD